MWFVALKTSCSKIPKFQDSKIPRSKFQIPNSRFQIQMQNANPDAKCNPNAGLVRESRGFWVG
jgi:hypothetical protein